MCRHVALGPLSLSPLSPDLFRGADENAQPATGGFTTAGASEEVEG